MAAIRHLPVIQNWDCHQCGSCCTDYWVAISDEERRRIEAQGWEKEPDFQGVKLFKRYGKWWRRKYRLNQREGGRCIFLSNEGLCRIHAKFGLEAKPFACRLYPYILVPQGDHWRVGIRFACPSAAANKGRPITAQTVELREMAREMETWDVRRDLPKPDEAQLIPPPPLQSGQRVSWEDLHLFLNALLMLLSDRGDPIARRMLKCLAFARLCREARFDKVSGPRLRELLNLFMTTANAEVPRNLTRLPAPGWIGRILFRTSLAVYIRKDQGVRRGVSAKGRIALMRAMWRMVRGTGRIPQLQLGLPTKMFADYEQPSGPLPAASEEALERYYRIKMESMQFCGPTHFDYAFWEGLESLALTLPMIYWVARGCSELGHPEAIHRGISVIDENFGYNPLLGKPRQRLALRILAFRRELDRLIAWYAR